MTDVEARMRGIGRMARDSGLTVSALRFYDGAGVLVPARVDPWSGYRWYGDDQVAAARLVAHLRRVGMPLDEIREVVARRRDPVGAGRLLEAHLQRLEAGLADARREVSAARSLLAQERPMTAAPTTTTRTTAEELATALGSVRHAVGADPELPMLTGVLLEADAGAGVRLVATDRYRLAVQTLPAATVDGPPVSALLPVALVDEVLTALDGSTGPATLTVTGHEVTAVLAGATLSGRRLDAEFPDYRRVLRPAGAHRVHVDAARLRAEVAAAPTRVVPDETGTQHTVTVLRLDGEGSLRLGDAGGTVLELGLNREFLLEALDAGGRGPLVLDLDGPVAPLVVRDPARDGDLRMLMPVRLS